MCVSFCFSISEMDDLSHLEINISGARKRSHTTIPKKNVFYLFLKIPLLKLSFILFIFIGWIRNEDPATFGLWQHTASSGNYRS